MDVFWIRVVSQLGVYTVFALYLFWTLRRGPKAWAPFLGTVLYAVVFEHFNMLRYAHVVGGYHYHPRSWLFLWGDVPLYIPLAWAFIVSTSQSLSDRLVSEPWRRPFSDALQALLIDFSVDIVAIRLGFWTWRGVGWNEAFFGVPADNFLGWLLVTFTFTALTRRLWRDELKDRSDLLKRTALQLVLIPPAAYLLYLGLEAGVHSLYFLFHAATLQGQLGVLAGVLALFAVLAYSRSHSHPSPPGLTGARIRGTILEHLTRAGGFRKPRPGIHPRVTAVYGEDAAESRLDHLAIHGPRQMFHLFGIIGLLCIPASLRHPALLPITLLVWSLEWTLLYAARSRG